MFTRNKKSLCVDKDVNILWRRPMSQSLVLHLVLWSISVVGIYTNVSVFFYIVGVVEYLLSGKVARTHTDFKDIGYEDALQKIHASNDKDSFCHDFRLNTAYEKDILPFTNYT